MEKRKKYEKEMPEEKNGPWKLKYTGVLLYT
jgi:hypothetical protein